MARRTTVTARIQVDDKASAPLSKVESRFAKLGKGLSQLPIAAIGVTAAIGKVTQAFIQGGREAIEYDRQVSRLVSALERSPGASEQFTTALKDQATALSQISGDTDTAIIATQALLAQMGVAPAQIKEATQASLDLSKALGIGLESAARNVGKTVGGFAGELGEVIPELKDLDAEALKAGDGIRLLGEKFAGTAIETANFGTRMSVLSNNFDDFIRALSSAVTESETAGGIIQELSTFFLNLTSGVEGSRVGMEAAKKTIKDVGEGLDDLGDAAEDAGNGMGGFTIKINDANKKMRDFFTAIQVGEVEALAEAFNKLGVESDKSVTEKLESAEKALNLVERAYQRGEVTLGSYLRAQAAFGDAQDEARRKLDESTESTRILTRAQALNRAEVEQETQQYEANTRAIETNLAARQRSTSVISSGRNANLISTQFGSQGTFTFRNGRRVFVNPDGRITP